MLEALHLAAAAPTFLTTWNIVMVALHTWTHRYVDILLTSTIVLAVSTYLLFVSPGYFRFPLGGDDTMLTKSREAHVAVHVLPFLFVVWWHGRHYLLASATTAAARRTLVSATLVVLAYVHFAQVEQTYDVEFEPVAMVAVAAVLVYVACRLVVACDAAAR